MFKLNDRESCMSTGKQLGLYNQSMDILVYLKAIILDGKFKVIHVS